MTSPISKIRVRLTITMAWWWPSYLAGVNAMRRITGRDVHEQRFMYWFMLAVHIKAEPYA